MPADQDAELLQRMAAGGSQAAELLQERYNYRLLPLIKRRLASFPAEIERRFDEDDVLQETWTTAIARAKEYRSEYSLFLWLRRICIDQIVSGYRRHVGTSKRDVRREIGEHVFPADSSNLLAQQLVSSLTSVTSLLRRGELKERLTERIETLDEKDREVLSLRHFEELTNQEVAELLNLSPQAASVRYTRALTRLGEITADLEEYLD